MFNKEKQGKELLEEAQNLGVALDGIYDSAGNLREAALQQRIRNAKTLKLAHWSLVISIISISIAIIAFIKTLF